MTWRAETMVGAGGFEPPTPCSRSRVAPLETPEVREFSFSSDAIRSRSVAGNLSRLVEYPSARPETRTAPKPLAVDPGVASW